MTFEETLLQKKEHAEDLIIEIQKDFEWFKKDEKTRSFIEPRTIHSNSEDCELLLEALQDFVEGTDKYLREKKL